MILEQALEFFRPFGAGFGLLGFGHALAPRASSVASTVWSTATPSGRLNRYFMSQISTEDRIEEMGLVFGHGLLA